jgi:hypothetical protein
VLGLTVNRLAGTDVPPGVVTVTLLNPVDAFGAIVTITGRLVSEPPPEIEAVMPVPSNVTPVAPVRFTPLIVAPTFAP